MVFLHEVLDKVIADHRKEVAIADGTVLCLGNVDFFFVLLLRIYFAVLLFAIIAICL